MIDPIGIPATVASSAVQRARDSAAAEDGGASFSDLLKRAINDTSGLQDDAKDLIGAFLRGEPVELHQVMAATEEASISLQLLVEIRNKLTEAYRSVMNMQ
jgi:flagellar hook-basal body complex protein FliE